MPHHYRIALGALALLSTVAGAAAQPAPERFSIREVDEIPAGIRDPANEDQLPMAKSRPGQQSLWLLRAGRIDGNVIQDAHAALDKFNGLPEIEIRLTPAAGEQFAALTKAAIGHQIAIVVDGKIVSVSTVMAPIPGGAVQITGLDKGEPDALAAEILKAGGAQR